MPVNDGTYKIGCGKIGVLLIHGLGGTPTEMRFVANGLAREGYTVHCVQMAGHGGAIEDLQASTWQDWYDSVERAFIDLREECESVVTGGLSTGALLSLLLAARHPGVVTAATLFSPTIWVNGWNIPWYTRLFGLVCSRRIANLFWFSGLKPDGIKDERIREFIAQAMANGDRGLAGSKLTPGALMFEHRRLGRAVRRELKSIHQPVLILHSREDDFAHLDNALYLQRNLQGPVEASVLNDCYHMITVDRQRHTVVERATAFVGRIVGETNVNAGASLTKIPVLASVA